MSTAVVVRKSTNKRRLNTPRIRRRTRPRPRREGWANEILAASILLEIAAVSAMTLPQGAGLVGSLSRLMHHTLGTALYAVMMLVAITALVYAISRWRTR